MAAYDQTEPSRPTDAGLEPKAPSGDLAEQRRALPAAPGVYLFRDERGEVLYVGKARSIRARVASHFSGNSRSGNELTGRVAAIEFLVTETEAEALLVEQGFIKRHRPRFNIRLRDDKSYPYIAVSLDEEFPRVYFTRERHRPGRAYFGPYSSAKRVRRTLDLLGRLFQYRTCEGPEPGRASGVPCLDYHIDRCAAPCVGYVDAAGYRESIDAIMRFLGGRYREVVADLERRMADASKAQEFERATILRDRLNAVRELTERQRVAGDGLETADLIGVAVEAGDANAQVFQVRDGVLAGRHGFYLVNRDERAEDEVTEEFLAQYYSAAPSVPRLVVVGPAMRDRAALIADALGERRGAAVEVRVAERGDKRRLRELAEKNARLALEQESLRAERRRSQRAEALAELATAIGLERPPVRIEGYDVSNLGGEHTVASMVVFEAGAPRKSDYRRFKIRADRSAGADDFASLEEVVGRRFERLVSARDLSPHDAERDESFASRPDLILIDGGRGQLGAALAGLAGHPDPPPVAALAKRLEEVYVPGRREAVILPRGSEGLRLLQRVRDEAHRFALEHHRTRRGRSMTRSLLDDLRGVGPKRKKALLSHFGSVERMVAASREEIAAVPGIPAKLAGEIHRQLNKAG